MSMISLHYREELIISHENKEGLEVICLIVRVQFIIETPSYNSNKIPKNDPEETRTSRRIIGNLRATVMKGSFGNQKQRWMRHIAVRNRYSETLQIFFAIHTGGIKASIPASRQMFAEEKIKTEGTKTKQSLKNME